MKYQLLFLLALVSFGSQLSAQCAETTVTVEINTDAYPHENTWVLSDLDGTIIMGVSLYEENVAAYTSTSWDVCVLTEQCLVFTMFDQYGDGITFPGGYKLYVDGDLILDEELSGDLAKHIFNCADGESCSTGEEIGLGSYTTSLDNHWYKFTPDQSGQYLITTCELTTCDTKIWVYDNCAGFEVNEDNEGTLFFDDNFNDCGEQANLTTQLAAGTTYNIRIGDDTDSCGDEIPWSISYQGEIEGCTDPDACNYNPAATINDGNCIYPGDPNCPEGPDLVLRQDVLQSSIYLSTINNSDPCLIEEGCLTGYGQRDIIRFSTRIDNIGEWDYFIGQPEVGNDQFTFDNCHNHWHYDGYAEYLLFDETGQEIPIGFKNGFCVIDLGCMTGSAQYYCNNMGISAGCYDEYWAELECQWIDVSDIPDGEYTFVARVNWDNAPDALGQVEKDSINNWAQVCIEIDRSSGIIAFNTVEDCPSYTDCAGILYGDTQYDCEGVCGGAALQGDANSDGNQDLEDVQIYAQDLMTNDIPVTTCSDISDDGAIDVLDLALLTDCIVFGNAHTHQATGPHNHCKFGLDITAINENIELKILDVNSSNQVDIGIRNPDSRVVAYQFAMAGIDITNVENLVPTTEYTGQALMEPISKQVMAYVSDSTFIERSMEFQPLVRISYVPASDSICISEITAIVNENIHRVPSEVVNGCWFNLSSTFDNPILPDLLLFPNPVSEKINLSWSGLTAVEHYEVFGVDGKRIAGDKVKRQNNLQVDMSNQVPGIYWLRLTTAQETQTLKFILQ